jgi:hypothetical protein
VAIGCRHGQDQWQSAVAGLSGTAAVNLQCIMHCILHSNLTSSSMMHLLRGVLYTLTMSGVAGWFSKSSSRDASFH